MQAKKLIINADDLGLTTGVTRGIIDAHLNGIVTSTSALMNSPCITESLAAAIQEAPELGVGIHLVLTWGKPILSADEVPALVDDQGDFIKFQQFANRIPTLNLDDVRAEWQAQIEAFIATGRQPDHLDSHHHCSYSSPDLFKLMLGLAQEYNLPIRYPSEPEGIFIDFDSFEKISAQYSIPCPRSCITSFYGEGISVASLTEIISLIPEGISELMCHPGYANGKLITGSSYAAGREQELRILTDPEIKTVLEENGVSLGRFSDL